MMEAKKITFEYKGQKYYWLGNAMFGPDQERLPEDQALLIWYDHTKRTPISLLFNIPKIEERGYWYNKMSIEDIEKRWDEPLRKFWILLNAIEDKKRKRRLINDTSDRLKRIIDKLDSTNKEEFFEDIVEELNCLLGPRKRKKEYDCKRRVGAFIVIRSHQDELITIPDPDKTEEIKKDVMRIVDLPQFDWLRRKFGVMNTQDVYKTLIPGHEGDDSRVSGFFRNHEETKKKYLKDHKYAMEIYQEHYPNKPSQD